MHEWLPEPFGIVTAQISGYNTRIPFVTDLEFFVAVGWDRENQLYPRAFSDLGMHFRHALQLLSEGSDQAGTYADLRVAFLETFAVVDDGET